MLRIEIVLVLLALLIAWIRPKLGSSLFERLEQGFVGLSRRGRLSVLAVGLAALALRAILLPLFPIPEPVVHDEFGYLLAADTFAHGHLTNPTPPMWVHFESFNILLKPTYQCITPPAQGLILAVGKVLFGHPFWGVWLSAGLMCAAITWMLQGWMSPEFALLGGVLAILRYGVLTYWADSYWGGAVGAIGGALVLGALPRIKRELRVSHVLVMAFGLALLANNRPYDGFVFSLPAVVVLLVWMFSRESPRWRVLVRRFALPFMAVLTLTAVGTAYYFWRVTGSPLRMPYQVERETYGVAPYLLWQPVRPEPSYHHVVMRNMYVGEELVGYQTGRTIAGQMMKSYFAWRFYLGPLLSFPFIALAVVLPYGFSWKQVSTNTRLLLITLGVFGLGCALESFYVGAHYSSPVTGLVLALVVLAMKVLRQSEKRGVFLTRALVVCATTVFTLRAFAGPLHIPLTNALGTGLYERGPTSFGRSEVKERLEQLPGKQLVIVHYAPKHEPFEEWVYNDADIDGAKVVWAREMDLGENRRLLTYFKDRTAWLLEADKKPPALSLWVTAPLQSSTTESATRPERANGN
jgi:hypothetical protein